MHETAMTAEMQALMDHSAWVQELAHKLVRDPNVADDLAQETLLAALKGGSRVRSSRAWLGTVLRNLLWQRMRSERRRRSREEQASRAEGTPSSADLVERMSAHREVVNTVMTLPEHYRIVLLRRYFEGETPAVIAEHLDMPVSSVKTRLARALNMMRERLDETHGKDGKSWMLAMAPLLQGRAPVLPLVPARAMALAAGCAVMVATVAMVWPWGGADSAPMTSGSADPVRVAAADVAGADQPSPAATERAPVRLSTEVMGQALDELNRAPRPLHGSVFGAAGQPQPGVVVTFTPLYSAGASGTPIGISDAQGGFEIPRAVGTGLVKAASSELVTVIAGMAIGDRRDGLNVVVAPRRSLRGVVTDTAGRPLADAEVELEPPAGFAGRFGEVMQNAQTLRHRVVTDEDGSFSMDRVPGIEGSLIVQREGFLPATVAQPTGEDAAVRVTLHAPEKSSGMIEGHVLGLDGMPLASVRVSCGVEATRTDETGRFLLDITQTSLGAKGTRLIAAKPGYLPAFLDAAHDDESEEPVWPENIELTLGAEPLEITGTVINLDGRGLAGMRVWIADPTVFSHTPGVPGRGYETHRYELDELDYPDSPEVLESYLDGRHHGHTWNWVKTDADGVFRIGGLARRNYTLVAMDPETLVTVESAPVAAGSEARLTLDLSQVFESLTGKVIDRAGRPAGGVRVQLQRTAFRLQFEGNVIQSTSTSCAVTVTDLDGSFSFYDVARVGTALRIDGLGIVPEIHPLGPDAAMEITVARHVHMQVFSSVRDGDRIGVLDGNGEELPIHIIQGTQRQVMRRADLVAGRSGVLSVPDHAASLVLYAGEQERRQMPLQLAPGLVNQIRF